MLKHAQYRYQRPSSFIHAVLRYCGLATARPVRGAQAVLLFLGRRAMPSVHLPNYGDKRWYKRHHAVDNHQDLILLKLLNQPLIFAAAIGKCKEAEANIGHRSRLSALVMGISTATSVLHSM